jgi:hypothetical protein
MARCPHTHAGSMIIRISALDYSIAPKSPWQQHALTLFYLSRNNSTLAGSKIYSSKFYFCENSEDCEAVLLYVGYIMGQNLL